MKILVTGFTPFGNDHINSALEVLKNLSSEISGVQIIKVEIPTVFGDCANVVHDAITSVSPDYVLSLGQAGGRYALTPERVAINFDDSLIADNKGQQALASPIHEDGQNAYFTQLPVNAMVQAIRATGLPAFVSTTAGTFVCNHIMYQVQYMIDKEFHSLKAGFVHIPFLPQQVIARPNTPSLSLTDDVKGITAAIRAIIKMNGKQDISRISGHID